MSDQPGRLVADLDGSWLIVAAANGAARNPAWFHDIATHLDKMQMEVDGRTIPVRSRQVPDARADLT